MRIYFSSQQYEFPADPEVVLNPADVMVSYLYNAEKIHPRVQQLMRDRKRRKKDARDKKKSRSR